MTVSTDNITPLKRIFIHSEHFSIKIYLFSIAVFLALFAATYYLGLGLYVLIAIAGSCCLWIMLHYPKIWIYSVILGCSLFFDQSDNDLDALDVFAAILFNSFLIIWFIGKLLVKTEKNILSSVRNNAAIFKTKETLTITNISEKLLILFYFFLLANAAIAYFNGILITDWLREFMRLTLILYFFPIIEYMDTPRSIVILVILLGLVVLFVDSRQFYYCYLVFKDISYAFQIGGTIRANQGVFSAAAISGIVFYFFSKKKTSKLFSFIVTVLSVSAVITTFSRAYWASILACTVLLLIFLNYKQILQLFLIILLSFGLIAVTLDTFLPQQSNLIQQFITKRFTSTTKGRDDISVRARINEMEAVQSEIKKSPLFGYGLRSTFSHYFCIRQLTVTSGFIHNGYVFLAHKAGIPMSALFYLSMILFTIRGFLVAWRLKKHCNKNDDTNQIHFYTALAICATLTFLMLFATNFVTTSFFTRDGFIITAIVIAFIKFAEQKLNDNITQLTANNLIKIP